MRHLTVKRLCFALVVWIILSAIVLKYLHDKMALSKTDMAFYSMMGHFKAGRAS